MRPHPATRDALAGGIRRSRAPGAFAARRSAAVLVVVAGLCAGVGCGGGGGGGGNDNQNGGPTPVPTSTPAGQTASVTFTVTASAPLQSFRLSVLYPTGKGSFSGSADGVACTTGAGGTFVKNDRDDGGLVIALAQATSLTFPVTITCTFDVGSGQTLAASDLGATIFSVTSESAVGNPATAAVSVAVH